MLSRGSVENDGYQQDRNRNNGNGHEGYPGDRADNFVNGAGPNPGIGIILDNDFNLNGNTYPQVVLLLSLIHI